jgi:hypothetical protein
MHATYGRLRFADITAPLAPADWDAVNTILNAGDIPFPKIKVSQSDRAIPPERFTSSAGGQRLVDGRAVLALFHEGASFGITGADSHWPPLRSVVDCLYDALLETVHTNVYCSPANTQGFQCHFDLHEVFVLQVSGEKHWRVFRPTEDAPVGSWRAEDAPHTSSQPYLDVVLRPGDVLYVPRGHWHYAIAHESTSLHVTVGVTCRKGTAFLDWLSGELLQDAAWRRNMPLMTTAASVDGRFELSREFVAWGQALAQSLTAQVADPDLFERFCKDTLGTIQPAHNVSFVDDALIDALRFERPAGRRHYIGAVSDDDAGAVVVTAGGSEIRIDGADADLIRRMFAAESFTADDIRAWKPGVDMIEMADVLTELTRSGLLIATRNHDQ